MDSVLSNISIYWENLSPYYVICVMISFFAVIITWWYLEHDQSDTDPKEDSSDEMEMDDIEEDETTSLLSEMKVARQEAIDQELSEGMSEEQFQQEKETEKEQLAAIFNLLREQEEKFQVNSIEELQSQMKLYRR